MFGSGSAVLREKASYGNSVAEFHAEKKKKLGKNGVPTPFCTSNVIKDLVFFYFSFYV